MSHETTALPDLQADDFALFGLARRFAQDEDALRQRWQQLQRMAHPDRFVAQGAAAQRVAMQWSVRINQAWQRLKDPLRRAAYLCELRGAPVQAEDNTAMPMEFLLRQMQWREALEAASTSQALEALAGEVAQERARLMGECARLLDEGNNAQAAAERVRALMFIGRFADALGQRMGQQGQ